MTGDNPIASRSDDLLGRARFADEITRAIRKMNADHGVVIGLMAPWGYGKTSVLNMVIEDLAHEPRLPTLQFNPWMFSGSDQLVHLFFDQMAAQLRLQGGKANGKLADRLIAYGEAVGPLQFIPVAGVWITRGGMLARNLGRLLKGAKKTGSVTAQRKAIEEALTALPEPLVVVLDDIDRLTAPEIRDIFRLVRLTAHFPNVIYLLAFDRGRVERALDDDAETGRAYLEKIIEVDFDLPAIPGSRVIEILNVGLVGAIGDQVTGPFDETRWADIVVHIMYPLFRSLRDVNRYLATLPATLATIGEEVSLVDVLALEAIRQRRPQLFAHLPALRVLLTQVGMQSGEPEDAQARIRALLADYETDRVAITGVLRLLFPATERYLGGTHYGAHWLSAWRRERRVASPDVLDFYLNRALPATAVDATTMNEVLDNLADPVALQAVIDTLDGRRIEDLLDRLEAHVPDIPETSVQPACRVFLDQYAKISRASLGMHDPGPEHAISRVVLRLLRLVESEEDRIRIVQSLDRVLGTFAGRLHLLSLVGMRSPEGTRLLPPSERDQLRQDICRRIRHAEATALAAEPNTLNVLAEALAEEQADRDALDVALTDIDLVAAVLRSALSEVRSQAFGSVAVRRQPVLQWETLVSVAGSHDSIQAMINLVESRIGIDPGLETAVDLAGQYLRDGPPPLRSMPRRPLVRQVPQNSPHSMFTPPTATGAGPALVLVLRALTTYDVDPAWDAAADLSAREIINILADLMADQSLPEVLTSTVRARGFDATHSDWEVDPDSMQTSRAAVARLTVTTSDGQQVAAIRYGILLSDQRGPARIIADVLLSLDAAQDEQWFPLGLDVVAVLLNATLACLTQEMTSPLFAHIFSGEVPVRASIELHLDRLQTSTNGRSANTLNAMLDLAPLGPPSRHDQQIPTGMFAVAGDTPLNTDYDRTELLREAIERIARDWGYIDVEPGIPQILP